NRLLPTGIPLVIPQPLFLQRRYRTPDGWRRRSRDGIAGEDSIGPVPGILDLYIFLARIIVTRALASQPAGAVQREYLRCGTGAVVAGDLRVVAVKEEGEVELAVGGADLHFSEGVPNVCVAHLI